MAHTPHHLMPLFPPPLSTVAPPFFKAGIYHLPDGVDDTGLTYMLQQTGMVSGIATGVAHHSRAVASPLVVRRMPQLTADMQERIQLFDGAVLLLSAASAYRLSLAHALSAFLADSVEVPAALQWRLETILHEGISNAICHGSLELPPLSDPAATEVRLADAAYGGRMIALGWALHGNGLDCFIMDQGPGFADIADRASYKGLSLIQSMCHGSAYTYGGRCLDFHLSLAA